MSRRVGRPSTPQLDRASIGAAALELVDRDGSFTMPALAQRLGVQASSIYHHAAGRAAVVELVREQVTADIGGQWFETLPWDQAIDAWARRYRDAFAAHPSTVRLLATETVASPPSVAVYRAAAAGLLRAGFRAEETFGIIVAIENFILGAALDAAAPDEVIHIDDEDEGDEGDEDEGDRADEPLRRVLSAAPSGRARPQQAFDLGLAALIAGLRGLLNAEHQGE